MTTEPLDLAQTAAEGWLLRGAEVIALGRAHIEQHDRAEQAVTDLDRAADERQGLAAENAALREQIQRVLELLPRIDELIQFDQSGDRDVVSLILVLGHLSAALDGDQPKPGEPT